MPFSGRNRSGARAVVDVGVVVIRRVGLAFDEYNLLESELVGTDECLLRTRVANGRASQIIGEYCGNELRNTATQQGREGTKQCQSKNRCTRPRQRVHGISRGKPFGPVLRDLTPSGFEVGSLQQL